jgi:hypothetical protein
MATYDYIRLQWAASCNIGDPINIYYEDGFSNEMFFDTTNKGNGSLSGAIYEIEDEGKKVNGVTRIEKQTWAKKYMLTVHVVEAVADVLSLLPVHDTVTITDREGTVYICNAPDVTVEITTEANRELIEDDRYPIMKVDITFNAHQIHKTACCELVAKMECSDVAPTIESITEPSAGDCKVVGTAPSGMLVRLYQREWLEAVTAELGGKINDVCLVTDLIAYCCSNAGKIYKTIDGGNTWVKKYDGAVQLNSISFDSVDKIHCVGNAAGGDGLSLMATVGTDVFAEIATPVDENLVNVDSLDGKAYAVSLSASVIYYDGATWTDITPAWVIGNLYGVCNPTGAVVMVCGGEYYAITVDGGANWTVYMELGKNFTHVANKASSVEWVLGDKNGGIWVSYDNGATITEYAAIFGWPIAGLCYVSINAIPTCIAMDSKGYVKRTTDPTTWGNSLKQRGDPISNSLDVLKTATTIVAMSALGNGKVGTTETALVEDGSSTAAYYESDGITFDGADNCSYEFQVETYLIQSDPCEQSDKALFTT